MMSYDFAQRLRVRESQMFIFITILIGVFAGLAAVMFTLSIKFVTLFFFGIDPSPLRVLAIPTAISFVSGILLWKYFPEARGSGVPQTEAAFHLNHGQIGLVSHSENLSLACCVSGADTRWDARDRPFRLGLDWRPSSEGGSICLQARARNLVPVAAAAALGAAFNTPIAAVLFALEEIIGDMNAVLLGSAVAASVTAVVVERSILGNNPVFHVPVYHLFNSMELVAYAGLGIVGGILSLAFSQGLLRVRAFFLRWPVKTRWFQPAVGGLFIGALLIFVPQVRGVGYEFVDQALSGSLLFRTMVILCIAKLVATIISYASGNAGGIFCANALSRRDGRGIGWLPCTPIRATDDQQPWGLRLGWDGCIVCRNHSRSAHFRFHDF